MSTSIDGRRHTCEPAMRGHAQHTQYSFVQSGWKYDCAIGSDLEKSPAAQPISIPTLVVLSHGDAGTSTSELSSEFQI